MEAQTNKEVYRTGLRVNNSYKPGELVIIASPPSRARSVE